jgi:hypothetical protein
LLADTAAAAAAAVAAGAQEEQPADGKLKMLCLHGFLQNGNVSLHVRHVSS